MDTVNVEDLSTRHIKEYWSIIAYERNGKFCRKVWHSLRLLPFTSATGAATHLSVLYVPVHDLSDTGIQPLLNKLRQIDPSAALRIVLGTFDED